LGWVHGADAPGWGLVSGVVLTITTVHLALCEMRLGTLPSRNSFLPLIPRLPTTSMSARRSWAAARMAEAGSGSTATRP
jgi:multisubunit Na+/H+ antiporter MnhB subunit